MEEEEEGKQLNAQTLWGAYLSRWEEGETRRGDGTGCGGGGWMRRRSGWGSRWGESRLPVKGNACCSAQGGGSSGGGRDDPSTSSPLGQKGDSGHDVCLLSLSVPSSFSLLVCGSLRQRLLHPSSARQKAKRQL